jgi:hypothetical protein
MSRQAAVPRAAVGFRVKSGWACAVGLVGPASAPVVIDRCRALLSDGEVPESQQPYHAAMGKLEEDAAKIRARTEVVEHAARQSVAALLDRLKAAGYTLYGAGLVVGSQIDPSAIANPHIRAHALEGRLFRTVLQSALEAHGLPCAVHVERGVYAAAAPVLGRPEGDLKLAVAALGRAFGGPWRAEEKLASLAAWLALV